MKRLLINGLAALLRLFRKSRPVSGPQRILVIRRQKMGDMICTLPLLHALRKEFPTALIAVACDAPGQPIAQACSAVDRVLLLDKGWNRWTDLLRHAVQLQDFDLVIAAKGGFDFRLALLTRLTNATRRIGFTPDRRNSFFFTDTAAMPENPHLEHQIETQLRLLQPLGLLGAEINLSLALPEEVSARAREHLARVPFNRATSLILINISCHRPVAFSLDDTAVLIRELLAPGRAFGLVGVAADQPRLQKLKEAIGDSQVELLPTPGSLDLAALLERAQLFITPEGGAAHLSAVTQTPTLVLWSGAWGKWRPRGSRHVLVGTDTGEILIPVQRLLQAIQDHHLLP